MIQNVYKIVLQTIIAIINY